MEALSQTKNWNWYLEEYLKIENKTFHFKGMTEWLFFAFFLGLFGFCLNVIYLIFMDLVFGQYSIPFFFLHILNLVVIIYMIYSFLSYIYKVLFHVFKFHRHQELVRKLVDKTPKEIIGDNTKISKSVFNIDSCYNYKVISQSIRKHLKLTKHYKS